MEEDKEKTMKEKIDSTFNFIDEIKNGKIPAKKLRLPRKAKVTKAKLKKGYVGILKVDENGNISGDKIKLNESSFELKSGTYHASEGKEILMWDGKFPVMIQPTWSVNPIEIRNIKNTNETYGQPYIKAKLLKSVLVKKKSSGSILIWVLVAVGAVVAYSLLKGGI